MAAGLVLIAAAVTATTLLQARVDVASRRSSSSTRSSTSGWPAGSGPSCGSGRGGCPRSRTAPRRWRASCEREAELAAAEERTRIARELHDVVAHGLSLMVVQAEAAEEMLAHSPEAAVQPLHRVQDTGRQALAEMRRLLGMLRTTDGGPPATVPQPSLRRIPELVRDAADAGLRVERRPSQGDPVDLAPGRELAAFRIVQEALTNTRRHAGATSACVRLDLVPHDAADRGDRRRERPDRQPRRPRADRHAGTGRALRRHPRRGPGSRTADSASPPSCPVGEPQR